MQQRRDFIKIGAAGFLGLFSGNLEAHVLDNEIDVSKGLNLSTATWKKIQKSFNIDKNINYLNNGTMGLSPNVVSEAVIQRMEIVNSTGSYSGVDKSTLARLGKLMNCDASEVALTHNVSEGINIAAWALPLKTGDEVILTDQEHVGNALPWLNRKRKDGIEIRMLEIPNTAEECLNRIKKLVTPRTKVIAVPHVTCTTGQVLPVQEICEFAKSKGIKTFIDGAHGVGMMQLDLKKMGCDIYASCGHKWLLGPKGTGILYANKDLIEELDALFVGGYSDTGWKVSKEESMMTGLRGDSHRFFYGTQNTALYSGLIAAVDFLNNIGMSRVEERVRSLNTMLLNKLLKYPDKFTILTPTEEKSRCGILSIKLNGKNDLEEYNKLRGEQWILRYVAESDLNCIRISTHIYNTEEQVNALVEKLVSA